MNKELIEICELINHVEFALTRDVDWEIKYDYIFGLKIWQKIDAAGLLSNIVILILPMKKTLELMLKLW